MPSNNSFNSRKLIKIPVKRNCRKLTKAVLVAYNFFCNELISHVVRILDVVRESQVCWIQVLLPQLIV